MGIDYLVHYDCEPKRALTVEGLLRRLKGRDRAEKIVQLYREQGDTRSPSQMGFEMVRRLPDGGEETEVVVVQDLMNLAAELISWEPYCAACPANLAGTPFGCVGVINYPISSAAERWLLDQLPGNDHPLVFMLLQSAIREMGYSGQSVVPLRAQEGMFLQNADSTERSLDGVVINGNQLFELLFLSGPIYPAHGSLLLQFFGGVSPDLEADEMLQLANLPSQQWVDEHIPFRHVLSSTDDVSVASLKEFFRAIHLAFRLGVPVLLDV